MKRNKILKNFIIMLSDKKNLSIFELQNYENNYNKYLVVEQLTKNNVSETPIV
ncbi:hypothetical protein Aeqsu_0642 [Aequorivita sublithincola DSM 14238]|uniref:Uncharacterized protein n=1 Tax=Aequorivita sublithincola (strain DSM 14238 / LMG 21431 / ACAM 643 / 9-3) TaxID=746697 RepID=I3YT33_AEQSU|nr:hypothetical protein [Aequorivita sublithincola]AFL80151.1 hypothetical protein Aeqsu_0642 [Aequorivita sublithincola DSM 14238]